MAVKLIGSRAQDDRTRRHASTAATSVHRLDAMITGLLHFSRAGTRIAERPSALVAAVLDEALDDLLPEARAKVTVSADARAHARITPVALEMIVANLVDNALKYGSPERENVVHVSVSRRGDQVELAVADNGVGIPKALLPRIFEPFFRGSERPDSYGLGLATVKRLVDAHDGAISVESEQGWGTTFVVSLPAAPHPASRPPRDRECDDPDRAASAPG